MFVTQGLADFLMLAKATGVAPEAAAKLFEAFNPVSAIPVLAANGVTMVGGGTAFYQMYLTEQRKDPATPIIPSLRKMSGGGAPMPPEIFDEVKREFGVKICHGYGMTEIPMITASVPSVKRSQSADVETVLAWSASTCASSAARSSPPVPAALAPHCAGLLSTLMTTAPRGASLAKTHFEL